MIIYVREFLEGMARYFLNRFSCHGKIVKIKKNDKNIIC